jgi:hypothetical protein
MAHPLIDALWSDATRQIGTRDRSTPWNLRGAGIVWRMRLRGEKGAGQFWAQHSCFSLRASCHCVSLCGRRTSQTALFELHGPCRRSRPALIRLTPPYRSTGFRFCCAFSCALSFVGSFSISREGRIRALRFPANDNIGSRLLLVTIFGALPALQI